MIKENQKLLNWINVASDGFVLFLTLPVAFWLRFYVLPGGIITVPLSQYILLDIGLTALLLFTYAAVGMYQSFRAIPLRKELPRLWLASVLDMAVLLSPMFLQHDEHFSRATLGIFLLLGVGLLSCKRIILRTALRSFREKGYNQKHVVILGSGRPAWNYLRTIRKAKDLGYHAIGYVSSQRMEGPNTPRYLGGFEDLDGILEKHRPDEVVSAVGLEDYHRTPQIISACEKTGTKLSIIPIYAEYMTATPHFDDLRGIPLMNIRRIPLDNLANAFCKRAMDIAGSLLLIALTSPVMLVCAIGVRLSSPGPIIFKQVRVGLNKENFYMYKFRSMRVNDEQDTHWSSNQDSRKTKFGALLRKCSLDEFPQFFNVLKGDMSLVGPRPEIPFYVDQFKEEIPLYMVKHQVRPGITGWAQVNGLRGDTSIKARIEHDIYYIEHWSLLFDLQILLRTVFRGKFLNSEDMG